MRTVLLLSLAGTAFSFCPPNSQKSKTRSKCYSFHNLPMTFHQAEAFCSNFDGHLASITNAWENAEVTQAITQLIEGETGNFWLGANKPIGNNNEYSWTDETPFFYSRWDAGQPDPVNSCVTSNTLNSEWSTASCTGQLPFVCISEDVKYPSTVCPTEPTSTCLSTCPSTPTPSVCPPPPAASPHCPNETYYYLPETKHCYLVIDTKVDQPQAESRCTQLGGHLASIHNDVENEFVNCLAHDGDNFIIIWIGLQRADHDRTQFQWTDGSPYDYSNWNSGEPNDHGVEESCVSSYAGFGTSSPTILNRWDDEKCSHIKRTVICKLASTQKI